MASAAGAAIGMIDASLQLARNEARSLAESKSWRYELRC